MFDWFDRRRREEAEERRQAREALLSTIRSVSESQLRMMETFMGAVKEITGAQVAQTKAIDTHLSLFKTVDAPTSSTMTGKAENDEWARDNGFPDHGTPEQQAKWIWEHDVQDD